MQPCTPRWRGTPPTRSTGTPHRTRRRRALPPPPPLGVYFEANGRRRLEPFCCGDLLHDGLWPADGSASAVTPVRVLECLKAEGAPAPAAEAACHGPGLPWQALAWQACPGSELCFHARRICPPALVTARRRSAATTSPRCSSSRTYGPGRVSCGVATMVGVGVGDEAPMESRRDADRAG
jgi:hypothetical protein